MTVNLSLKKTIITVVLILASVAGVWWYISTADSRAEKAEINLMIKYAQKQALEIAIIEQASKLTDYRKQLVEAQKSKLQPPPPVNPFAPEPIVPDPKSLPEE